MISGTWWGSTLAAGLLSWGGMRTALMLLTSLLSLPALAQRQPLAVPGWEPQPVEAHPVPADARPEATVAQAPRTPKDEARVRRVAVSFGAGVLALAPSVELEVAPVKYLSVYGGLEGSVLRVGGGGQVGLRVRPFEGLGGPFLDAHLRFSEYAGALGLGQRREQASPGVMGGVSHVSATGLYVSAGLGLSFLAEVTRTQTTTTWGGAWAPLPTFSGRTTTGLEVAPELRLQVGWAL